jgi:hypothetical protein
MSLLRELPHFGRRFAHVTGVAGSYSMIACPLGAGDLSSRPERQVDARRNAVERLIFFW